MSRYLYIFSAIGVIAAAVLVYLQQTPVPDDSEKTDVVTAVVPQPKKPEQQPAKPEKQPLVVQSETTAPTQIPAAEVGVPGLMADAAIAETSEPVVDAEMEFEGEVIASLQDAGTDDRTIEDILSAVSPLNESEEATAADAESVDNADWSEEERRNEIISDLQKAGVSDEEIDRMLDVVLLYEEPPAAPENQDELISSLQSSGISDGEIDDILTAIDPLSR